MMKIDTAIKNVKLVVFDLDGTLTPSKGDLDEEMAELIRELLKIKKVAVIGGGKYEQFQKQFLDKLNISADLSANLFLFPTTSTAFYSFENGSWRQIYEERLSEEEKGQIFKAFDKTFNELNYSHPRQIFGELIEDRGTQITFSALGQKAPLELKSKWAEEHFAERLKIAETLQKYLPSLEVRTGGYTSVDVTRKGIDKEYGINQIQKNLGIALDEMIFVGDALYPGGNDYAALLAGVACFEVRGPEDTKKIIQQLIS